VTASAVTVRIERSPRTGLLSAYVVQEAADGEVRGRNLLGRHEFTAVESACREARHVLEGRVRAIEFTGVTNGWWRG
jgi:hypothetical protein